MTHLPFTLLAYFFNASAVTIDKFMLSRHIPNPLVYIFYFSAFSALALILLPFTKIPTLVVFLLASLSSVLWTTGAYFMFKALQIGQVSRVIPIIGTLVPVFLLFQSIITGNITAQEILAVFILILGLVALTILDWKGSIKKSEVLYEILAALLFAVSYIILREAYLRAEFLTVLVWSRFIILPVSIIILLIPSLKKIVFESRGNQPAFNIISKSGLLFLIGQGAGGASELLLTYSISLANPALVNSLQGSQYIFLFIFSLLLAKKYPGVFTEKFTALKLIPKILGILLIGTGLFLLAK